MRSACERCRVAKWQREFTSLFTSQKGKINENFIWQQLYNFLFGEAIRYTLLLPGIPSKTTAQPEMRKQISVILPGKSVNQTSKLSQRLSDGNSLPKLLF